MKFVLFSLLGFIAISTISSLDIQSDVESRVTGGTEAFIGQFPFMVTVRTGDNTFLTNGWIYNNRWVVTVAKGISTRSVSNLRVATGTLSKTATGGDATIYLVASMVIPPGFDPDPLVILHEKNVALLKTTTTITFTAGLVTSIPLSPIFYDGIYRATVSGWAAANAVMRHFDTYTFIQANCRLYYEVFSINVSDSFICASATIGSALCAQSQGIPLVIDGSVVGMYVTTPDGNCNPSMPSPEVYIRLAQYAAWIRTNAGCQSCGM